MKNAVIVIDDAFEDTFLIDELYKNLILQNDISTLIGAEEVFAESGDTPLRKSLTCVTKHLWMNRASALFDKENFKYFEVWHNKQDLPYHLDKDEELLERTGELRSPIFSSVFYLGPQKPISGGELFINTQGIDSYKRLTAENKHLLLDKNGVLVDVNINSNEWVKINFKYNRFVIFDSSLAHLVAPVISYPPNLPRISLGINPWSHNVSC